MPLYEFRCSTCAARAQFASAHDAAEHGWGTAHIIVAGGNRYVVACPKDVPDWMKKLAPAGAKKKG